MNFKRIALIGAVLISAFAFHSSQVEHTRFTSNCDTTNDTFKNGEELVYTVYYNWNFVWIPAGEAKFIIDEDETTYRYRAYGRTFSSYEWFYKVRDRYETRVDKATLLPIYTMREVHEGDYHRYAMAEYDYDNGQVNYQMGKSRDSLKEVKTMPMSTCMHDVLSILYYARNIDYEVARSGDEFPTSIFMDDEELKVTFTYEGKERKKVKGLGKFKTIKLTPHLIDSKVFKEGDEMEIWASNDDNRVPLLIESPVTVGSVKAVLKSHNGLKYDLSCQIN